MQPHPADTYAVAPTTTGEESNALAPLSYWIQVVVVDEWGDPVEGARILFDFDDGNRQASTTDTAGLAAVMMQPSLGVLVRIEGNVYFENRSGEGTFPAPHETEITLGPEKLLADLAASSTNQVLLVLSSILTTAHKLGHIGEPPKIELVKVPATRKIKHLEPDDSAPATGTNRSPHSKRIQGVSHPTQN